MLFGIIDHWSLWHAGYGITAAESGMTAWQTACIAFAWEWFEWSGAAVASGLGVFHIGPDSGGLINSLGDVGIALLARAVTLYVRRAQTRPRPSPQ